MRTNFFWKDNYISMVRGDTLAFGIKIDGLDQDLDKAYFTVKKNLTDDAVSARVQLYDGIEKVETGKYIVRLAPAQTRNLEAGKYYYDMQIKANGDVFTILKGVLELEHDVTREA